MAKAYTDAEWQAIRLAYEDGESLSSIHRRTKLHRDTIRKRRDLEQWAPAQLSVDTKRDAWSAATNAVELALKTGTDFTAIRSRYICGTESFTTIAAALDIAPSALEYHSAKSERTTGKSWGTLREEWQRRTGERAIELASVTVSSRRAMIAEEAAVVSLLSLRRLAKRLEDGAQIKDADLCALAKLSISKSMELTVDSSALNINSNLDALTIDQLKALSE